MIFFSKTDICHRCHAKTKLKQNGFCKTCDDLKKMIEKNQERCCSGNFTSTESDYNYIREAFSYKRDKLNVQSAETVSDLTEIEKSFLATLDSKSAEQFYITGEWIYQHFIDSNYLISKFLKNEYLEFSKLRSFDSMTVTELKQLLKANDLKATGTKSELIAIAEQLSEKKRVENSNGEEYLRLTEKGLNTIGKKSIVSRNALMENECLSLIMQNRLQEAWSKVCEYESHKLVKRGISVDSDNNNIGIDWNNCKKIFYFTMETKLPFSLPNELKQYEKELRVVTIYCDMMGTVDEKRLFLSRNKIDSDRLILDRTIQALRMMVSGAEIPANFSIDNEVQNNWKYSEDAGEIFIAEVEIKLKQSGLDKKKLVISTMTDGTLNFTYKGCQFGRIKFGKRTSKMQVITKDFVEWIENKSLEVYIGYIEKWMDFIKDTLKK